MYRQLNYAKKELGFHLSALKGTKFSVPVTWMGLKAAFAASDKWESLKLLSSISEFSV